MNLIGIFILVFNVSIHINHYWQGSYSIIFVCLSGVFSDAIEDRRLFFANLSLTNGHLLFSSCIRPFGEDVISAREMLFARLSAINPL